MAKAKTQKTIDLTKQKPEVKETPVVQEQSIANTEVSEPSESYSVEVGLTEVIKAQSGITRLATQAMFSDCVYIDLLEQWVTDLKNTLIDACQNLDQDIIFKGTPEEVISNLLMKYTKVLRNLKELHLIDMYSVQDLLSHIKYVDGYTSSIMRNEEVLSFFVLSDVLSILSKFCNSSIVDTQNITHLEKDMNTIRIILDTVNSIDDFLNTLNNESYTPDMLMSVYSPDDQVQSKLDSISEESKEDDLKALKNYVTQ